MLHPEISIYWPVWVLFTGIALFSYWFNYCMGNPLADDKVDPGAIFFFIPEWLALRKLPRQQEKVYEHNLEQDLSVESDKSAAQEMVKEFYRKRYERGRVFFSWEQAILCPVCLHWWLCVLVSIATIWVVDGNTYFFQYPGQTVMAYLVSHLLIRKIV